MKNMSECGIQLNAFVDHSE